MHSYDDVYSFLARELGVDPTRLTPDTGLFDDLGVDGDDFFELEQAFARHFNVDMSSYRWYFHHGEEGLNVGGLLSSAPYCRVEQIPVTPRLLLESANAGRWMLEYPSHELPTRRYDIVVNLAILVGFVLLALYALFRKFMG